MLAEDNVIAQFPTWLARWTGCQFDRRVIKRWSTV